MHTIEFDAEIERQLTAFAQLEGKDPDQLIKDAVAEYLEVLEDIADAREALQRVASGEEETIPWESIKAEHGL